MFLEASYRVECNLFQLICCGINYLEGVQKGLMCYLVVCS